MKAILVVKILHYLKILVFYVLRNKLTDFFFLSEKQQL